MGKLCHPASVAGSAGLGLGILMVGVGLLLATLAVGMGRTHPHVYAQGIDPQLGLEIEKTLDGSEVVQVGQVLQFTIRIRNTGSLSITHLVVEDVFDSDIVVPSGVGEFAEPDDPPHSTPLGTISGNTITWDDVVENLPDQSLDPNEELFLHVRLRAVHPTSELSIVNEAAIKEAIQGGELRESGVEAGAPSDVGGSNAPVTKEASSDSVGVGMLITYTIRVENDSLVPLDTIPMRDTYNPAALDFVRADPPASAHNETSGVLEWSDLLAITGQEQLEPGETVEIMTVYRALQPFDTTPNEAEVYGARDRYGNELTPRQARAPIRIVPAATATATTAPAPTATPTLSATAQATATATSTPVAQATAVTTATATPTALVVTFTPVPAQPRDSGGGGGGDDDDDDDEEEQSATATTVAVEQIATQPAATTEAQATATMTMTATATATATPAATATPTMRAEVPSILPGTGAEATPVPLPATALPRLNPGSGGSGATPSPDTAIPVALPRTGGEGAALPGILLAVGLFLLVGGGVLVWRSRTG